MRKTANPSTDEAADGGFRGNGIANADDRSCEEWWRRTQRIRTAGVAPFEAALFETMEPPVYQRIARKALHLRELGLSDRVIAGRLGVTDKTIAKAVSWLRARPEL